MIDLGRGAIERTIAVGDGPEHVPASLDGRLVLGALPPEGANAVIDAERLEIAQRIPGGDAHQIAF
ncbi:MAG: hypothetical protein HY614_02800 [Candidatus Rokubacteria bacterium]|nr:hypothetical protein [Candidatus Rokubacteria bacterium]